MGIYGHYKDSLKVKHTADADRISYTNVVKHYRMLLQGKTHNNVANKGYLNSTFIIQIA